MRPYEPFYYPYDISPSPIHPVTLPLRQEMTQLQKQRDYCRYLEATAAARQAQEQLERDNYARSILANDQIENGLYRHYYEHELDRQMVNAASSEIEYNYLRKVEELRRERQMLENPAIYKGYATMDVMKRHKDQQFMSDDELVHQYGSGYRAKQYRQELKEKLASTGSGGKSIRNNHPDEVIRRSRQRNGRSAGKNEARSKEDDQAVKRSYIDDLNKSYEAEKAGRSAFKRSREDLKGGQTIDVLGRTFNDSSAIKAAYLSKPKKKGSKKVANKSITQNKPRKRENYCSFRAEQPSSLVTSSAMQKINNRLKVSEIVYKDSKLRHDRHEMNHLFGTFENEVKIRKEVKDKLNNHPSVLKKHNIVVESR